MSRRVAGRRVAQAGVLLMGAAALSGCGGAGTRGFEADTAGAGTTLGNLIAFNKLNVGQAPPAVREEKLDCPTVEVLDGTASSRVYASADKANSNVRYQFSLGEVVRECSHVGQDLVVKVGIEGRALIGPAGSPGSFTAPVRIAIRREKDQTVATSKLYRIPVTVEAGASQADFQLVSDPIAVPFTRAQTDQDYTVVVGLDTLGGAAPEAKVRKVRHRTP